MNRAYGNHYLPNYTDAFKLRYQKLHLKATKPSNELPQSLMQGAKVAKKENFYPFKHLHSQAPKTIYTMEQIGLQGHGILPHAVPEPFPLFTKEVIALMRAEIFDEKGTVVVIQGRYIEHQALKALGGRERISMVTCFREKSPYVKDETVIVGVRGISDISKTPSLQSIGWRFLKSRFEIGQAGTMSAAS